MVVVSDRQFTFTFDAVDFWHSEEKKYACTPTTYNIQYSTRNFLLSLACFARYGGLQASHLPMGDNADGMETQIQMAWECITHVVGEITPILWRYNSNK